jgi:hypothetical protein
MLDSGVNEMVTLYGTSRVRKLILLRTPNLGSVGSRCVSPWRTDRLQASPEGDDAEQLSSPHPLSPVDRYARPRADINLSTARRQRFAWSI